MNSRSGLTLIEVLIAMLILGVLLVTLSTALVPMFRITASTQKATQANITAQAVMETVHGQFANPRIDAFKRSCVSNYTLPGKVNVTITTYNSAGQRVGSPAALSTNCGTAIPDGTWRPYKLIIVEALPRTPEQVRLVLEVPNPNPHS